MGIVSSPGFRVGCVVAVLQYFGGLAVVCFDWAGFRLFFPFSLRTHTAYCKYEAALPHLHLSTSITTPRAASSRRQRRPINTRVVLQRRSIAQTRVAERERGVPLAPVVSCARNLTHEHRGIILVGSGGPLCIGCSYTRYITAVLVLS